MSLYPKCSKLTRMLSKIMIMLAIFMIVLIRLSYKRQLKMKNRINNYDMYVVQNAKVMLITQKLDVLIPNG